MGRQRQCRDVIGLGQPTGAAILAGEAPVGGLQHGDPPAPQRRNIILRRRVFPHLGVHRRGNDHRAGRDEAARGEQVIRAPHTQSRHKIGRGRGDHDEVGLLTETDVLNPGDVVPDGRTDRITGQGLPGGSTHEVQCGFGGNDVDVVPPFREIANEVGRLKRSNAAPNTHQDAERLALILLRSVISHT